MPTYSYACRTCEHYFEVQQSFSDSPISSCPNCGSEVKKVFGNLGVSFKGSGFYRTDSAKKPEAKKDSGTSSD
jgi:putative FmdB family regulatory protein